MRRDQRLAPVALPSLQTSTLLCVKNLQAICGGCMLTCPGWAVWGGGWAVGVGVGTSWERGTYGTFQPDKGAPLPGCTAKPTGHFPTPSSGAPGLCFWHGDLAPADTDPRWTWTQTKQHTDMSLHEKHWGVGVCWQSKGTHYALKAMWSG